MNQTFNSMNTEEGNEANRDESRRSKDIDLEDIRLYLLPSQADLSCRFLCAPISTRTTRGINIRTSAASFSIEKRKRIQIAG